MPRIRTRRRQPTGWRRLAIDLKFKRTRVLCAFVFKIPLLMNVFRLNFGMFRNWGVQSGVSCHACCCKIESPLCGPGFRNFYLSGVVVGTVCCVLPPEQNQRTNLA